MERTSIVNRLNRRRLLGVMAVGIVTPSLSGLLSACGGDDDEPTTEGMSIAPTQTIDDTTTQPTEAGPDEEPTPTSERDPDSPTTGGQLNIAWNNPPPDFNPITAVSRSQAFFFYSVMSSLVKPNIETLEFEPDLAEAWEVSPDGDIYTFTIRSDAKWHDGEPVLATDIAFTYRLGLDPATESRQSGKLSLIRGGADFTQGNSEEIPGIRVEGNRHLVFEMEFPNGLFLTEAILPVLPEHVLGTVAPSELRGNPFFSSSPIGSGPFKFVEYRPDQYVDVEAFSEYHFGEPKIANIRFHIIGSPDTMDIAMGRGEIDMPVFDGGTAATALFEKYIQDEGFRIIGTQGSAVTGYGWNFRHEYLQDPRIKQALLHAIDRRQLVSTFNANNGTIFNSFMTHAWYQKPEWEAMYPYDPEKARSLLAEANWDSDRTLSVNVQTLENEEIRAMVAAEQQMLSEVGLKIQFQEMETAVWVEKFYDTHDFDLVRVTFGVFPDPDGFLNFHMKTGTRNAFGYANADLDAKIEQGRRAVNLEDRIPIYQEINEEMLINLPVAPLFMDDVWWIMSNDFHVPAFAGVVAGSDLSSIPVVQNVMSSLDVWTFHQEQWEKRG